MTGIALSLFFYSAIHVHYVLPDVTPPIMRLRVHVSVAWGGVGYYICTSNSAYHVPIIVTIKPSKLVLTITSIIIT